MPHTTSGVFLHELRRVADTRPDHAAVIDEDRVLTYANLVAESDALSHRLRLAGLRHGDRVALVAENSSWFLVAAFATWTAEGVLVTIYPSTAHEDLAYTLADADPVLVLVDSATAEAVAAVADPALPVVRMDVESPAPQTVRAGTAPTPTDLRAPLFLICYSSGTTSRPKAIMLSQEAMFNGARTYSEVWHLGPDDRTIVCLPMAWLYGLDSTSMATLLVGGTVVSLRRARPDLVASAIERHRATFLPGVTTIFAKLVELLEGPTQVELSSLRLAVSGGEPRNEAAFERFERAGGPPVFDTYCASECFPLITYDPLETPRPVHGSAGKLVPRSDMRVVTSDGRDVDPGQTGEAWSRGPGLMLGYWNDEAETIASLTPDGWYRTKDLVRVDESGYVFVTGRLSSMIIRGGSNVSPAEVERTLRENADIADVCVVGLPDPMYGEMVAAGVVLAEGVREIDHAAVKRHAAASLASFKIPTVVVALPSLPTSPTTGKIDRRAVADLVTKGMNDS